MKFKKYHKKGDKLKKFNNDNKKYLGWDSYENWNVMLWINNTEHLYFGVVFILKNTTYTPTYREVVYMLNLDNSITGDGVSYISDKLNYEELNLAIETIKESI